MPKLIVVDRAGVEKTIEADTGLTLMEAIRDNGFDELLALCAPRLTFVSYGVPEKGDAKWLDHQGSFMAAVAAEPVFRLLGAKDLGVREDYRTAQMPGVNVGLLEGQLAWRQHDGHYSLVSSAVASGLVSLFVSGQMVQSSEGEITSAGLRPDLYGISRNGRKPDTTRFDWGLGKMRHGDEDAELPPGSQDVLGFPFHLAMTVDESIREWHLWVSNGRKLQDYLFHNLGREHLKFGEAEVETLHLQGSRAGEGTLDVWLAPSRHWLPVRIRTQDQKGKVLTLKLEEIS